MKVKKNDTVLVLTGKDNGKIGKVLSAHPSENRVVVDGVNVQKRSKKARSAKETSGIVEQFGKIDASNVMVVCPVCGKATRVAYQEEGDKKVRICKKCGKSLDVSEAKAAKTAKKATKKTEKTEKAEKAEKKTTRKKKADAE
ncbi:MAG: 50S ribosomal protein L24 [Clostridia bacterium]|nr:50S ribosomal protein L24 [Clostridia bacterium]